MEKFVAVVVNKGRKFRGEAYDIGAEVHVSTFNIYGYGRSGWRSCESVKLWSPTNGFVWCNPSYIEDREVAPEVEQASLRARLFASPAAASASTTPGCLPPLTPSSTSRRTLRP